MEVELMVTKRDDDRQPTDNRQGEYRAICLGKGGVLQYLWLQNAKQRLWHRGVGQSDN